MSQTSLNEVLGPLLGFLFTTGTLLFIAFNASKTGRPAPAGEAPGAPEAAIEPPVENAGS